MSAPTPARASLVFEILGSPSAPSGGSGSFDIALADTDASGSTTVSNFQTEISVAGGSGVSFTGISGATTGASYIFGTVQSPPMSLDSFSNTGFTAADTNVTAPGFITLNPGDVVGLVHVSFSVATGTPVGPVTVSFVAGGNTLSDQNSNPLAVTTAAGAVSAAPAAVPEPSPLILGGIGGALALAAGRLRRKRRAAGTA